MTAPIPAERVTAAAEAIEDAAIPRIGRDLGTIHRDDIVAAGLRAALPLIVESIAEVFDDRAALAAVADRSTRDIDAKLAWESAAKAVRERAGRGFPLNSPATSALAGTSEPRPHDPTCHADPRAHWTDCECWCHDGPATSPTGDPDPMTADPKPVNLDAAVDTVLESISRDLGWRIVTRPTVVAALAKVAPRLLAEGAAAGRKQAADAIRAEIVAGKPIPWRKAGAVPIASAIADWAARIAEGSDHA